MPAESDSRLRAEMEALRARLAELERAEETARALIGVGRELVGTSAIRWSATRATRGRAH
jgi:hypothetical protein